jgi:hypothetical protein
MNCNEVKDRIPELIHREMPLEDRNLVLSHLACCDSCRTVFKRYSKIRAASDAALIISSPATAEVNFYEKVTAKIERRQNRDSARYETSRLRFSKEMIWTNYRGMLSAAAMVMIILCGLFLWMHHAKLQSDVRAINLVQSLEQDDWITVERILTKPALAGKFVQTPVPVNFLLQQLEQLSEIGVKTIRFSPKLLQYRDADYFASKPGIHLRQYNLPASGFAPNFHEGQISVQVLSQLLQELAPSQNEITIAEIASIINLIQKSGELKS